MGLWQIRLVKQSFCKQYGTLAAAQGLLLMV
jgi:hypothetical protein